MTTEGLKIVIVEDEYITQKTIENHLTEIGYQVVGKAMDAISALAILKTEKVDFAILDINIKGDKNGIWLANEIKTMYSIPHLFLTAYSNAVTLNEALQTEPYGYLVKPFQKHDLFTAIEIAILNFNKIAKKNNSILVKHNEVYKKVALDSILYIESDKNYLIIKTTDIEYKYRSTISEFQKQLPKNFIKTHKGFIINANKIISFNSSYININDNKLPISKTYKEEVISYLQTL
jgi:two-component system response regulator LytT